jgi:Mrp family chromosome partitioning ATPase
MDPQILMVTSAEAHEGVTTCAANLAIALRECNRARVLLVEANLLRPSLMQLFRLKTVECFSNQMALHREQALAPWSVVEVMPSLHVAPVVPVAGGGRPLLDGPALAAALASLHRIGYDYIVVDTPPILGSADANLVEENAHGVLLATWSGRTSARALGRAVEQLTPSKILGFVLLGP